MMDISAQSTEPKEVLQSRLPQGKAERVPIAAGPLSPWLRLAVLGTTPPEHAVHTARLRTILDFEIVLQVEGQGWIWSEAAGGSIDIYPGDLIFFPPNHVHAWAYEAGTHLAIHFDFHAQPELEAYHNLCPRDTIVTRQPGRVMPYFSLQVDGMAQPDLEVPMVTTLRHPDQWRAHLEPLVHLWHRHGAAQLMGQLLVQETVGWALRELSKETIHREQEKENPHHHRIHRLLNALAVTPPLSHLSVSELAHHVGMGETAFRVAFLQVTGCTPHRYLEERRIERAARALLETNQTVSNIARMEGYEDPYHFSRVFKRITGQSPAYYRARIGLGKEKT